MAFVGIGDNLERVSRFRDALQPQDKHRGGGSSLFHFHATVIDEGAHTAENGADQEVIPDFNGTVLYQDSGDRPLTAVQLAFENRSDGGTVRIRREFFQVRDQQDHFQ